MTLASRRSTLRHLRPPGIGRIGRRRLLACGIAFPALWVGMDVVAALLYDGYSYRDQTVSELSAVDAPTRTFWMIGGAAYSALELAFAAGVWQAAGRSRALRAAAGLFAAHAILNAVMSPFSSMHQRQVLAADGGTVSDTLHLAVVGIGGLMFFAQVGLAAAVLGKRFRAYSLATALAMAVFGFVTSLYAEQVSTNEPTPWLGIYERISSHSYMLWVVVLALVLRRRALTANGSVDEVTRE